MHIERISSFVRINVNISVMILGDGESERKRENILQVLRYISYIDIARYLIPLMYHIFIISVIIFRLMMRM